MRLSVPGRELGFPFFGERQKTIPGNLGSGNRAAERDLFFVNSDDKPVAPAGTVLYMYFLPRSQRVSFEEKDIFTHNVLPDQLLTCR